MKQIFLRTVRKIFSKEKIPQPPELGSPPLFKPLKPQWFTQIISLHPFANLQGVFVII
jgi:hypothetical protein